MTRYSRFALALASISGFAALTGCGLGTAAGPTMLTSNVTVSGHIMGGHQPVTGSLVTLYAAGTTAYGSAPTSLGTATTDGNGGFALTSSGCTDPAQLYIVAQGGNAGAGTNAAATLVAALGTCSNVTGPINVNEVTTVAAAYTLAGFADKSSGTSVNVGSTSTNTIGLQHAFLNANNLVDYHTGLSRTTTPGGNGTVPAALINTLANALAACVNSVGTASSGCNSVLVAPPAGTSTATPATTWQLALNWALYPGNNVAAVYANPTAQTSFFTPTVGTGASAPTDLSIGIAYTAGVESGTTNTTSGFPWDIKADSSGNVWISGQTKVGLTELGPNGNLITTNPGGAGTAALNTASTRGIGIDTASPYNVWVADTAGNVYGYTPSTATTTAVSLPTSVNVGSPAVATTVSNAALGVAVDALNNVWYVTRSSAASTAQTFGEIPAGTSTAKTAWTTSPVLSTGATAGSYFLAVDATTNNVWSGNQSNGNVFYYLSPYTSAVGSTTGGTGTTALNNGVAFDASGNTWFVTQGSGANGGKLLQYSPSGALLQTLAGPAGATLGLDNPRGLAIDGVGRLFVTSFTGTASVVEYDPALASTGSLAGYLVNASGNGFNPTATSTAASGIIVASSPRNITIDQAGATWTTNGSSVGTPAAVQIFGIAAPVNPVLAAGQYGVRP